LHPETPAEGVSLAELFRGRFDVQAAHRRLGELCSAEGLEFSPSGMLFQSRRAQELGALGEAEGKPEIHGALYRAVFVDGADIYQLDELARVAEAVGLDPDVARRALADGSFAPVVDADWDYARQLGVTAVPTFVCEGRAVVGAQSYDVLKSLVLDS
jgi:predicted DsbA family dithiol-disulfide isomerase